MRLRFYHDPDTDLPHIYNHGVSEQEVEDVLRLPLEEAKTSRNGRIAIGQTRNGRFLKVVYSPDEFGDGIFVVTAYDLTGKAFAAFGRRMRKRRQ
jgi:uncharacterized DUF497 family protein